MVFEQVTINGTTVRIHQLLKQKLDNVKKIMKKSWDCVFVIDGIEGSGKSTLSFLCGWYVSEGKLTLKNICEGTEDAVKKLQTLPDKSILIIDEGSLSFSSTEVMRREQRTLVKILNVIRQRCMCLIIVAPSFFNLNKYISVERSRFLIHVYTDKDLNRGRFCYFSQKKKKALYSIGKKNFNSYNKPKSDFTGLFTKFEPPFYKQYLRYKNQIIKEQFEKKINVSDVVRKVKFEINLALKENYPQLTQQDRAKVFNINPRTLRTWESPHIELGRGK